MGIMASICMHSFMACSLSRNHVLDALGLRNVSLRHSFNIIWQYGHINLGIISTVAKVHCS